jgi:DNA-binding transcriptional LysR family regulator
MWPEERVDELAYRRVTTEPFVVMFPSDHRLAAHDTVELREIVGETFVMPSKTAFLVEEEAIDDAGGYVWIGALDLRLIAQSARPPSGGLAGRQPSFLPAHASPARTKKRGQALRSASSY